MAEPNDANLAKNPAYRPATEKALVTGLFLCLEFAGDSSGSPRGGADCSLLEPLGAVAPRGLEAVPATSRAAARTELSLLKCTRLI
jgi:hypothetical protein